MTRDRSNAPPQRKQQAPPFFPRTINRDVLAVLILLGCVAVYGAMAWGRIPLVFADQGWGMQVATRLLRGELLYKDVIWSYGPWPVYVYTALFSVLGVKLWVFSLVGLLIATASQLLTYMIMRHLLEPGLALLGTVAVSVAVDGGLLSSLFPYVTAVSWGALFGLLTVWGLVSSVGRGRVRGLVLAGAATGCAVLTKPEYAAACLGVGLCHLGLVATVRQRSDSRAVRRWPPFIAYLLPAVLVVCLGYGFFIWQAGGTPVWSGVSGYRTLSDIGVGVGWPGQQRIWLAVLAGVSIDGLLLLAYLTACCPKAVKRRWRTAALMALCLSAGTLAFLPLAAGLRELSTVGKMIDALLAGGLTQTMGALANTPLATAVRYVYLTALLGGSVFLVCMLVSLVIKLVKSFRGEEMLFTAQDHRLTVLAVYSCLVTARFYFLPPSVARGGNLNTLAPIVLVFLIEWLPRSVAVGGRSETRTRRGTKLLAVAGLVWMVVNIRWGVKYLYGQLNLPIDSRRGSVLASSLYDKEYLEVLAEVESGTEPQDRLFVMGHYPGFYLLSDTINPTFLDLYSWRMVLSNADLERMLGQLKGTPPKLIVVHEPALGDFERLVDREGRFSAFVAENYRVKSVIGDFSIYECGGCR